MWWKLWRKHWRGLLIEMFAVFIGVSAAFAMDSYRERSEKSERRQQIVQLFLKDIADAEKRMEQQEKWEQTSPYTALFLKRYEAGEMPEVQFFQLPEFNSTQVWMGILQAGGGEVLDTETLRNLENLIILNEISISQHRLFNDIMREQVLSSIDNPATHFYDLETKKLRKSYAWLPYYLQQIQGLSKAVPGALANLRASLEAELKK